MPEGQGLFRAHFVIPVEPVAKGRPRLGRTGGSRSVAFTPASTRRAESDVIALVGDRAPSEPVSGPVTVKAMFVLPIPRSWPRWRQEAARRGYVKPTKRPDLDNLTKMVVDALTRAGFWRDDDQVVKAALEKKYGLRPRTEVWVEEVDSVESCRQWLDGPGRGTVL